MKAMTKQDPSPPAHARANTDWCARSLSLSRLTAHIRASLPPQQFRTMLPATALLSAFASLAIVPTATMAAEPNNATSVKKPSKSSDDATNQSSRERDRILLKRNPIASEYQLLVSPGTFFGAPSDAEGVDFRAQFSLSKGQANASKITLEGNMSYQDEAAQAKSGGGIELAKSFGPLSLQFSAKRNASERFVDLYQARWLAQSRPNLADNDVLLLGFPRYSRDTLHTTNLSMRWRADYQLRDDLYLSYEGNATNYDDVADRNRLEFQNGVGDVSAVTLGSDGSTIDRASIDNSRIRRYFHETTTKRDINRHRLALTLEQPDGSLEIGGYYSHWQNQSDWLPWNFIDSGISSQYQIDDRYLPTETVANYDQLDISQAQFANYRPSHTVTTDKDYALLLDWDHKLQLNGRDLWLGAGVAWRNKQRNNSNETGVYGASEQTFDLTALSGNHHAEQVIEGQYQLPAGMVNSAGAGYLDAHPEQFDFNVAQSMLSSIQNLYTSEETVSSGYINAYQQREQWFWRVGLRYELTKTNTRGAVSGPPDAGITEQGDAITHLELNGADVLENFDSFDAAFVEGNNRYHHLLPSAEVRFQATDALKFKLAYFEQLMRPQYYDTVRYRRINPPMRTIEEGSPELAATTIHNLYAGFDYRYADAGQLAAGVYYNKVANFFYDSVTTEPLDGIIYDVTRVENGNNGYIQGVQAYWSQAIRQPWLTRMDVELAYVYSDTEAELAARKITMPERAKHRLGFNLTLADGPWQYNSRLVWQSEALDDVGQTAAQDTFREDVLTWDQAFSWRFNRHWRAKLSVNNLLNRPDRSYQGEKSRVVNNLYSGTMTTLSVQFTY